MNGGVIIFLLLPIALVLLLVNSQRKRTRQATALQSELAPGAEVCTTSGLFGSVVSLDRPRGRARRRTGCPPAFRPPGGRPRRTVGGAGPAGRPRLSRRPDRIRRAGRRPGRAPGHPLRRSPTDPSRTSTQRQNQGERRRGTTNPGRTARPLPPGAAQHPDRPVRHGRAGPFPRHGVAEAPSSASTSRAATRSSSSRSRPAARSPRAPSTRRSTSSGPGSTAPASARPR